MGLEENPKKWKATRGGPEEKLYYTEVKIVKIKNPPPPSNFPPEEPEPSNQRSPDTKKKSDTRRTWWD